MLRFAKIVMFHLSVTLAAGVSAADMLTIRITQGIDSALPIAIVPFGWSGRGSAAIDIADIIAKDLARSGRFAPMPFADLPARPAEYSAVDFRDWRLLGMENLVIGKLVQQPDGAHHIEFRLVDVYKARQLAGFRIPTRNLRLSAHQISDIIYEKLTGERGAFATRIAYVTVDKETSGKVYRLLLADADGHNSQTLLKSSEPLLSPAWSPDGKHIAYVSFENRNSAVWVQDVLTSKRQLISSGPGINSAPAWSPDGTRLAMTLSKHGNPEIYVMHVATRQLQRLTNNYAIDTEPSWSPDGRKLVFTSDRGGGPQIYEITLGGSAKRLTFGKGTYNARPRFSPNGRQIAMVTGGKRGYQIAVLDLPTDDFRVLTEAHLDESPSFAPNGSMIIYTTMGPRGTELAATSVDGRVKQRLTQQRGEVREPAWGPFRK